MVVKKVGVLHGIREALPGVWCVVCYKTLLYLLAYMVTFCHFICLFCVVVVSGAVLSPYQCVE